MAGFVTPKGPQNGDRMVAVLGRVVDRAFLPVWHATGVLGVVTLHPLHGEIT
jgi:hypothetical protein